MKITMTFHGPFRVGTGSPVTGVDSPVDSADPLPTSSVKGLLRAEARDVLRVRRDVITGVFGGDGHPARWYWGRVTYARAPRPAMVARIAVDEATGVAKEAFLAFQQCLWTTSASIVVEPAQRMDATTLTKDTLCLRAAARSVSAVGSLRRRGYGWVSMTDDEDWTNDDTAALLDLLEEDAP